MSGSPGLAGRRRRRQRWRRRRGENPLPIQGP
jgi:hypothetical protein